MQKHIALIDDDPIELEILRRRMRKLPEVTKDDFELTGFLDIDSFLNAGTKTHFALVLLDNCVPPHQTALDSVPLIRSRHEGPLVCISQVVDQKTASELDSFYGIPIVAKEELDLGALLLGL